MTALAIPLLLLVGSVVILYYVVWGLKKDIEWLLEVDETNETYGRNESYPATNYGLSNPEGKEI